MSKNIDHFHEQDDPTDAIARNASSMRWKAIEGITCAPGLSPTARRVCILLITTMNAKTRLSFRGERRIAAELGVHVSAVKKAKRELKSAGFITWSNPGGPRHLSHYNFNWQLLSMHSRVAKSRGKECVEEGVKLRSQEIMQNSFRTSSDTYSEGVHDTQNPFEGTQIEIQGSRHGTSKVPPRVSNLTLPLALNNLTQRSTPFLQNGELRHEENICILNKPTPLFLGRKGQSDNDKEPPVKFPELIDALGNDPKVTAAIWKLPYDVQAEGHRILAAEGMEPALAYILKQSS